MQELLKRYPALHACKNDIELAFTMLADTYQNGGKLLVCGNGGSASDSEHIVGELMKGFLLKRKIPDTIRKKIMEASPENGAFIGSNLQGALPAISLVSHTSLTSSFANDIEPSLVFAQQVFGYGKACDTFLGLSTSGSSKNIVYAAEVARALGLKTIAMTGQSGGQLINICECVIRVPSDKTPEIQELHLPVYHYLCSELESIFFGGDV